MSSEGFIYFASNVSFRGLLKVGMTTIAPKERLQALDSTGVPSGFTLEMCFRVKNVRDCESKIHKALENVRETADREFFRLEVDDALRRCVPILLPFLFCAGEATTLSSNREARMPEIRERVMAFVAHCHPDGRAYTFDVAGCLGISENEAIFQLGELKEVGFVRSYSESRGVDYWIPLHKGIRYLKFNPVEWMKREDGD